MKRGVGAWALHIAETSLVLVYKSEDNGVTYTDRFVLVRSTHTSLVHFCWTSPLKIVLSTLKLQNKNENYNEETGKHEYSNAKMELPNNSMTVPCLNIVTALFFGDTD